MPRLSFTMRAAMASLGSCLRPSHVHLPRAPPSLQKLFASSTSLSLFSQGSPLQVSPSPFCVSRMVSSSMSSSAIGFRKQRDVMAHSTEGIAEANTSYAEKSTKTSSKSLGDDSNHPWEEWGLLLQRVQEQGYQRPVSDNGRKPVPGEGPYDSYSELKHALLNFARDRDDMFVSLPKEHLRVIAAAGCPDIERKSVNSAKRLRAHSQIDEASACTPCGFRKSCPRAFGAASGSHIPSTQEVVRIILAYAMRVKNPEADAVTSTVQDACCAILSTLLELSNNPRDPNLPRAELPVDLPKKPRSDDFERQRDSNSSGGLLRRSWEDRRPSSGGARSTYEPLPGDWRCPGCNFDNFARNTECRNCGGDRPAGTKGRERGSYGGDRKTQGYREQSSQGREWSSRGREGGFQSRWERDEGGGPARYGGAGGGSGRWAQDGDEWDRRQSRDGTGRGEREPLDNERRWGLRSSEREPERESNPYPPQRQPMSGRDRRDSFRETDNDFEEEEEWSRREVQSEDVSDSRPITQASGRGGGDWDENDSKPLTRGGGRGGGDWDESDSKPLTRGGGRGGGDWDESDSKPLTRGGGRGGGDWDESDSKPLTRGGGRGGGDWDESDSKPLTRGGGRGGGGWVESDRRPLARGGGRGGRSWGDSGNQSQYRSERENEGRGSYSGFRGQSSSRGRTDTWRGGYGGDRSRPRSDDSSGYGESRQFSREWTPRGRSSRGRGGPRNMGSRSYSTSSQSNDKDPEENRKVPTRDFWDDYAEGI